MAENTNMQPTIKINGVDVNRNDYISQLNSQYDAFFNTYKDMWSKGQQEEIVAQKDALIKNIQDGNISQINNGTIDINNVDGSGLDTTRNGAGAVNIGYASKIGDWMIGQIKMNTKINRFDNTTLSNGWNNYQYGGNPNYDLQIWKDLDPVGKDGKRGKTNRINAVLGYLNSINLDDYNDVSDTFNGMNDVRSRLDALKQSLADGVLNNNDYVNAARLGFDLRTLLSDDAGNPNDDGSGDTSGGFTSGGDTSGGQDDNYDVVNGESVESLTQKAQETGSRLYNQYKAFRAQSNHSDDVYDTHNIGTLSAGPNGPLANGAAIGKVLKSNRYNSDDDFFKTAGQSLSQGKKYFSSWCTRQDIRVNGKNFSNGLLLKSMLLRLDVDNPEITKFNYYGRETMVIPYSMNLNTGKVALFDTRNYRIYWANIGDPNISQEGQNRYKLLQFILKDLYPDVYKANQDQSTQQTQTQTQEEPQTDTSQEDVPQQKNGGILKAQSGAVFGYNNNFTGQYNTALAQARQQQAVQRQVQLAKQQAARKKEASMSSYEKAANKKVRENGNWELSAADKWRLAGVVQDAAALVASAFTGYGTAAAGVLGLTSMGTDLTADIMDDSMTAGDVAKNALVNLGYGALGLLPGGKAGSLGAKLMKWAPRIIAGANATGLAFDKNVRDSLTKMVNGDDLTTTDYKNFMSAARAVFGIGQMGVQAGKNRYYSAERQEYQNSQPKAARSVNVKQGDQKAKVNLTPKQIKAINKAKTQKDANAKLQEALNENRVKNAQSYSVTDNFRPETRSFNPLSRFKQKNLEETGEARINGSTVYTDRYNKNQTRIQKHPVLSKFFNTNYDVYAGGKSSIKFPHLSMPRWGVATPTVQGKPVNSNTSTTSTGGNTTHSSAGGNTSTGGNTTNSGPTPTGGTAPVTNKTDFSSVDNIKSEIQNIFAHTQTEGKAIKPDQLNKFLDNHKATVDKLSTPDKDVIDTFKQIMTGKGQDRAGRKATRQDKDIRKELFDVISRIITLEAKSANSTNPNALQNAKDALAAIKYEYGGVLKFAAGGNTPGNGGINNTQNNTTWYGNIFSPTQDYILSQLQAYGNDNQYMDFLNKMQTRHHGLYQAAGGVNGNFIDQAYNGSADDVRSYQKDYDADSLSRNTEKHGYNARAIQPAWEAGRYRYIGHEKRNGGDSSVSNWRPDGSYSGQTDDRRLLGRQGDFTTEQLTDWNNKLKSIGMEQYLGNDGYYYLRRTTGQNVAGTTPENGPKDTLRPVIDKLKELTPALLGLRQAMSDNKFNNKQRDLYLSYLNPVLEKTYDTFAPVRGDYATQNAYQQAGAATQNIAAMNAANTSDADRANAIQMQGMSQAADLSAKGKAADNAKIEKTAEVAKQHADANLARRVQVANNNYKNLIANERERANVMLSTNTMNHNNWKTWWQTYVEKPAIEKQQNKEQTQQWVDAQSALLDNELSYSPKIAAIQAAYKKKYDAARTEEEQTAILTQMQNELSSLGYEESVDYLKRIADLAKVRYNGMRVFTPTGSYTPPAGTPPIKAKKGTKVKRNNLSYDTMVKEDNKTNDRLYKQWKAKLDAFWKQFGKMRQAKY